MRRSWAYPIRMSVSRINNAGSTCDLRLEVKPLKRDQCSRDYDGDRREIIIQLDEYDMLDLLDNLKTVLDKRRNFAEKMAAAFRIDFNKWGHPRQK